MLRTGMVVHIHKRYVLKALGDDPADKLRCASRQGPASWGGRGRGQLAGWGQAPLALPTLVLCACQTWVGPAGWLLGCRAPAACAVPLLCRRWVLDLLVERGGVLPKHTQLEQMAKAAGIMVRAGAASPAACAAA